MQPVLLGRSFAPLQGETGQWTAEMHSNHQTTGPTEDYCEGKDKSVHFTPQKRTLLLLRRRCGQTGGTDCFSSSKEHIIVLICNFSFCSLAYKSITVKSHF